MDVTDAPDPEKAAAAAPTKKAPLLYEKEIDLRLRKTKPWLYDPKRAAARVF